MAERGILLDPTSRLVTVKTGELNIHQDQVRDIGFSQGHPFFPGNCFGQLIACAREEVAQDTPVGLMIFNNKDSLVHETSTWRSTLTGKMNMNVAPAPTFDSTQMRPPCISTIRLAIASPRPVPPFARELEPLTCWNSSKILC